jgi:hypothetical protein
MTTRMALANSEFYENTYEALFTICLEDYGTQAEYSRDFFRSLHRKYFADLVRFEKLTELCESPIEKQLLLALAKTFEAKPSPVGSGLVSRLAFPNTDRHILIISPQEEIEANDLSFAYRVDFLAVLKKEAPKAGGEPIFVEAFVIEADGHDYHERTKEQAARDKERDRNLQIAGYKVFHFTGSEIYRGADKASRVIFEYVADRIEKA